MSQASAPSLLVPPLKVVSVEHPCIVKNTDKAIRMIGGDRAIADSLQPGNQRTLSLKFKPDDAASRSVLSLNNSANNVLLKITVPKGTGRKRKRGSKEPFVEVAEPNKHDSEARRLIQAMEDNPDDYTVEPVGQISSTHIWRAIPDFVYSTQGSAAVNEIRSKILPQQYPLLKEFHLPRTYGLTNTEVIPPPVLSTQSYPFNYNYRQNPAVKNVADATTGKTTRFNSQASIKLASFMCKWDDETLPSEAPPDLPAISTQNKQTKDLHEVVQKLFEERPIWSKRALLNRLPTSTGRGWQINHAIAYVAYAMRSGPWRDTFIRYGIDPRLDPAYRKYQTTMIQLVPKDERSVKNTDARIRKHARFHGRGDDEFSHIFSGTTEVPADGKVWQFCDMTDPQLKALVDLPDLYLRADCERRYFGWYPSGMIAKLKVGLRTKIDAMNAGEAPEETSRKLDRFFELPDVIDEETIAEDRKFKEVKRNCFGERLVDDESYLTSAYRSLCRAPMGQIPSWGGAGAGRVNKPKPETTKSYLGERQETGDDQEGGGDQDDGEDTNMMEPEEDEDDQDLAFEDQDGTPEQVNDEIPDEVNEDTQTLA